MKQFVIFFGLAIFALGADQTEKTQEKIKVIAKSPQQDLQRSDSVAQDPAGFVRVIDLKKNENRYQSIEEVLERESGVRVRRYGGLGSYATLSIRGSNANQVSFYIDGIPVQNNQGGEVNLADLPFDNLERIEIYKSGTALGFSASAIGGTVNLVTKKGKKKKKTRVSIAGGSFRTYKLKAFHANYYQDLDYSLFVQKEKSDGNFRFRNDNGTPVLNTFDDFDERRKNAWFDRYNFTTNLAYRREKTTYTLLNDFNYRFQGIPGQGNNQFEKVKRKYLRNTTALGTQSKGIFWDFLNLKTRAFYTGSRDDLYDPRTELGSGQEDARTDMQQYGVQLLPEIYLLQYYQILKFLVASERETFRREDKDNLHNTVDRNPRKFRTHNAVQIQDEFRFFRKRLRIVPSVLWEEYVGRFNEDWQEQSFVELLQRNRVTNRFTNSKLGFLAIPWQSNTYRLSWKANISRESRIPTFIELFGERGTIIGNTDLRPEQSVAWDAGPVLWLDFQWIQSKTSIAYFHKSILDMILFIPNSQFTFRAENVDSASIRGMELDQKFSLYKSWQWKTTYTYQRAINTSNAPSLRGKYLTLRPLHELHSGIHYRSKKFKTGAEATFIGAVYKDRSNEYLNYEPGRWLFNFYCTYYFITKPVPSPESPPTEEKKWLQELYLSFDVKNILDKRAFDVVGYPLPGRMYYVSLSALF
ncbi:MAG: TonB-dependent receptor plug domain-containing protein [Spirochaetota bacterium]